MDYPLIIGATSTIIGAVTGFAQWFARGSAAVSRYATRAKTLFDRILGRGPLTEHEDLSGWDEANNEFEMTTIPQIRSRRLRGLCVQLVQLVREVLGQVITFWRRLGSGRRSEYRQVAAARRGVEVCAKMARSLTRLNVLTLRFA